MSVQAKHPRGCAGHQDAVEPSQDHQDVLCKACKGAVKNWCRDRGPPDVRKGSFNDYFYRSMSGVQPNGRALAQNLSREVGGVFRAGRGRLLGLVTNPNLRGVARQAAGRSASSETAWAGSRRARRAR